MDDFLSEAGLRRGCLRFQEGRDAICLEFRNDVLGPLKIGYDDKMERLERRSTCIRVHWGKRQTVFTQYITGEFLFCGVSLRRLIRNMNGYLRHSVNLILNFTPRKARPVARIRDR